jgi:hypothetical protein
MKTISTLLIAFVLFASKTVQAQSQNFEAVNIITTLQSNCWNFYGISETTTLPIEGSRHLYIIPTTSTDNNIQSNSNIGQIAAPYLDFTQATTITFSYRLQSSLSNNAKRYITVRLSNGTTSQVLSTITLNNTTTTASSITSTISIPAGNGIKRLIFDFTGDGDGNTGMYFDNLIISGATYAYTASCGPIASASPLPIKLLSFSGSIVNKKAQLNWSVAENETGDRFEIEKSTDGRTFVSMSTLFTTDKIGTEAYSFRDGAELTATAYFRLKVINKDNSVSYSKIVTLKNDTEITANTLTLVQNPVATTLQFQYKASTAGINKLVIYNTAGMMVMSTNVSLQKGSNAVSINIDNKISTGTYFVEISNGTERSVAKMIKK